MPNMLAGVILENPKFAAALPEMDRRIEIQRTQIRALEKRFP